MNKKSLIVSFIIISLTCLSGYLIYNKLHTNSPDDIKDYTGKYILNPDYNEFHKYEWTDLKTVYPTKLAYDPAWFKLPPDKYIPKEQPIPKNITSISDPIIRRQAYFNFLCKSEGILYLTSDYHRKTDMLAKESNEEDGILNLLGKSTIPKLKNFEDLKAKNSMDYFSFMSPVSWNANGNPFINPIYNEPFFELIEGHTYNFFGVDLKLNPKSIAFPMHNVVNNQFIEFMAVNGDIFKIEYDVKLNKFLPAIKLNYSTARYYAIRKPIERKELNNLGINAFENIIYDTKQKKLVTYGKNFEIGSFLPWKTEHSISNFSWSKVDSCNTKVKEISAF